MLARLCLLVCLVTAPSIADVVLALQLGDNGRFRASSLGSASFGCTGWSVIAFPVEYEASCPLRISADGLRSNSKDSMDDVVDFDFRKRPIGNSGAIFFDDSCEEEECLVRNHSAYAAPEEVFYRTTMFERAIQLFFGTVDSLFLARSTSFLPTHALDSTTAPPIQWIEYDRLHSVQPTPYQPSVRSGAGSRN